jgi:amidohydrolase
MLGDSVVEINVSDDIRELYREAEDLRRELHKIPEIAFEEQKTRQFIVSYLKNIGLQVREKISKTGVVAYISGTEGTKTYAFRADMDALPIQEKTDVKYCSIHKGKMHACGHDGHMSTLLLLAKLLYKKREFLKDNILFIFQPAEEGPGGALPMIEEGVLKKYNVDAIFGLHIYPDIEQGKIGCCPGPMMAQTGEFDIYIKGKSSHGARPQDGKDSIVIAAQMVNAIQSIISRDIDPIEGKLITIGAIKGGEARNIIAGEAVLEGTMRAFKEKIYFDMKKRMNMLVRGIAQTHECEIDLEVRDLYPSVDNDKELFNILQEVIPQEKFEYITPLMIAEDFSFYQREVPGLFFLLGSKNIEQGYIHSLHSNQFNFDERILLTALQVYMNLLEKLGAI